MKKLIYIGSQRVSVMDKRKNRTVYNVDKNTKINLNGKELKDLTLAKMGWNVDIALDENNPDLAILVNILN